MDELKKDIPENDYCDLDPTKICDNCCKCIEDPRDDFRSVAVKYDADSMGIMYSESDEETPDIFVPEITISPELLNEWEARLREYEATMDDCGDTAHRTKYDAAKIYGVRRKKEHY